MSTYSDKADNHKKRQQKLKEKIDEKVAKATTEKGLIVVITGNGKGKSTSGFGTIARAVGHKKKCAVFQFIKGTWDNGEKNLLEPLGVSFEVMATNFTWETQDKTSDTLAAKAIWDKAYIALQDSSIDVVLLDELTYMISFKYLPLNEIINALNNRPHMQSVIITGRSAHRELIEIADTVSEVRNVKHAFDSGVKALQGIDW